MSDVAHGHIPVRRDFAERVADELDIPLFFLIFGVSNDTEIEPVVQEAAVA
jgi:hypothetical protein